MKRRNAKKGFTLIELVVVIAVIGILAGVSVATYFGVTNSAKESNDISLTKQMNDLLLTESALEGKNKTPHDAILDLKDGGLDVTKLTPTRKGFEFAYDLFQDKFFLLDGETVVAPNDGSKISTDKVNVFKFVGKGDQLSNEYSNYLKDDYSVEGALTISTGLDVGSLNKPFTINYVNNSTSEKNILVRTNSYYQNLDVNGYVNNQNKKEGDIINHFGDLGKSTIQRVAMGCYYENGNVGYLKLLEGKVSVKSGANVSLLYGASSNISVVLDGGVIEKPRTTDENISKACELNGGIHLEYQNENGAIFTEELLDQEGGNAINDLKDKESANPELAPNEAFIVNVNSKKYYSSFEDALKDANENDKISLVKDITVKNSIVIDKNIIVNLNGYRITNQSGDYVFKFSKENLSLSIIGNENDTSIINNDSNSLGLVLINRSNLDIKIKNITFQGDTGTYNFNNKKIQGSVFLISYETKNVSLTLDKVKVATNYFVLDDRNDFLSQTKNAIYINECDFTTTKMALRLYDGGVNANIKNTTIKADEGPCFEINDGKASILNSNFTVNYSSNPSFVNSAIAVSGSAKLIVDGGSYNSKYGTALYNYSTVSQIVVVKDGYFSGKEAVNVGAGEIFLLKGSYIGNLKQTDGSLKIFGGTFSQDPTNYMDINSQKSNNIVSLKDGFKLIQADSLRQYSVRISDLNEEGKLIKGNYPLFNIEDLKSIIADGYVQNSNGEIEVYVESSVVEVYEPQDIVNAISNSSPDKVLKIKIMKDITTSVGHPNAALILKDKKVEIDLNGHNFKNTAVGGRGIKLVNSTLDITNSSLTSSLMQSYLLFEMESCSCVTVNGKVTLKATNVIFYLVGDDCTYEYDKENVTIDGRITYSKE